jgi:hypothetical protein
MGATNTLDRVDASIGLLQGVQSSFCKSLDVPFGGLLTAIPALIAMGLLHFTSKHFVLPKGYYKIDDVFILIAFMALGRVRSIEKLRYESPGEWGKLLGLDRIPEVRTLRSKLNHLSNGALENWSSELCAHWMNDEPESALTLYVDGHVRVYHGSQTKLPRHYVARERLCLRATTDYWVNAMDGQPFMLVNKAVDHGLIKALEEDIVPRLLKDVPMQPTVKELEQDPNLNRFTLVFDREGYSPEFFKRMRQQRIACLSYHKFPSDLWPQEEFKPTQVRLISGEVVVMDLAERGTFVGKSVWMREIRKHCNEGKQTAILTTNYRMEMDAVAGSMFARWSQENFFRYMREHYGLDRLIEYELDEIPESTKVVNPAYRDLDSKVRKKVGILNRRFVQFGAFSLPGEIETENVEPYEQKKASLKSEIDAIQAEVVELKEKRKATPRHIPFNELPKEYRFARLRTNAKHLIDTIKMVSYRAETAVMQTLREKMARHDDARSLAKAIFAINADIIPDEQTQTLTVRLHHLANHASGTALLHLCSELNATETVFPGTDLRLLYELVSSKIPRDQEV